jgi:hypothetical protein
MDLLSFEPPELHDPMTEGLRPILHGTVHLHPLDVKLRQTAGDREERLFRETAAFYGLGFAEHLKRERAIIRRSMVNCTGTKQAENIHWELVNDELDDIDFEDMFEPNGAVAGLEFDPHVLQERRFFK